MKYTPKEIAELLKERPNQAHYIEWMVRRAVHEAVRAEREACAEECEGVAEEYRGTPWGMNAEKVCDNCTDAIRARTATPNMA